MSMRNCLKSRSGRVNLWFWALVLLALPGCDNLFGLTELETPNSPHPNLGRGNLPHSSLAYCDIEIPLLGRHCATATDKVRGTRLAAAAVALAAGQAGTNIGLDDSPAALLRCNGEPEAVVYRCAFPGGCEVCLNCGDTIGPVYADANAVCAARCEDFFGETDGQGALFPDNPPDPGIASFCGNPLNAHASVANTCFDGLCSAGGNRNDALDPRRFGEAVEWDPASVIGVTPSFFVDAIGVGRSSLARNTTPVNGSFDAGAASTQWITHGDGYVEFQAAEIDTARLCGLSTVPSGAPPDTDPNYISMGFAIDVYSDGHIYLFESGDKLSMGANPDTSYGTYGAGDRFRVYVRDNFNGTATISYSRIRGSMETTLPPSSTGNYPFRVDSSFGNLGATLTDVRIVRIH